MEKQIIALDADGVLLDYTLAYASVWQRAFGVYPKEKDPRAYWALDRWDIERLDGNRLAHIRAGFDDGFWESLPALPGATVEISEVRFLGSTLWTDYKLRSDRTQAQQMEAVERGLNGHRLIRTGQKLFTAKDALERHMESRAWPVSELAKPWEGKTVVVNHHGPHPLSTHPRCVDNPLNGGFVSDLSEIRLSSNAPDLWWHGHVHDGFDYTVGCARVVANPAGYIRNRRSASSRQEFEFENATCDPCMVLEV